VSTSEEGVMPFFDSNDNFSSFSSVMPKVSENLPTGKPTFGIYEFLSYTDTLIYETWMAASQINSMGLCGGLLMVSIGSRMIFMPF
jgi:hypothetical protein